MNTVFRSLPIAAASLLLLLSSPSSAAYIFSKIADTDSQVHGAKFISFRPDPAISRGTVAFEGRFGNDTNRGVFNSSGAAISTIAKSGAAAPNGTFTQFGLRGATISNGTTAFYGRFTNSTTAFDGAFTSRNGVWKNVLKSGDAAPHGTYSNIRNPAINESAVAFTADYWQNGGMFRSFGRAPEQIVFSNGDPPYSYTSIGDPAVSGNNVAYYGNYNDGVRAGRGLFIDSGGPTVAIVKTGDAGPAGVWGGFSDPSLSGNNVAFHASFTPPGTYARTGIFRSNGSSSTTIAKVGDAAAVGNFASFDLAPSISGQHVAFYGQVANAIGGSGIYVGDGHSVQPVILLGASLFGSKINDLDLGNFAFDDDGSGRLAFYYSLTNGRRGIAVAALAAALPGDFNGDSRVDNADYSIWKSSYGTTNLAADANGDGRVDAADYTLWRDNLGRSGGGASISTAVPEPYAATPILLLSLLVAPLRAKHLKFSPG